MAMNTVEKEKKKVLKVDIPDDLNDEIEDFNPDIKKLNQAISIITEELGAGLIATDIWSVNKGRSIAGYNSKPKICVLFNLLTASLKAALRSYISYELGQYYILDLADDKLLIVLPLHCFQWNILVKKSETSLGLLLNVVLPRITELFEEALKE